MKLWIEYPVRRCDVAGRIGASLVRGSRPMEWRSGGDAALRRAGESAHPGGSPRRQAYTLVEMMVATGLFSLVIRGDSGLPPGRLAVSTAHPTQAA